MIVRNELGLPQAFINALNLERHNAEGEYSATTLLKDATEVILTDRHFDEIEIDVADCVWQIFGTAVHAIFEKAGIEGFAEEKFEVPVSNSKVTGKVDLYDLQNEIIYDWKTASVYKWTFADFSDWDKQGLIYAWLLKQNGLKVKEIRFVALLKDHSKSKARKESDYPQKPAQVHSVKVTDEALAEIEQFIKIKVEANEKAKLIPDAELPPCSEESRWATSDTFAIMKEGRKSAVRVFDNKADAELMLKSLDDKHWLQERKGESRKCVDGYCTCRNFCPFYKSLNK